MNLEFTAVNLKPRNKYVDANKVQEHFALVPTEVIPDLETLSSDERLVYETVAKRTCLMFAADYRYDLTRVIIQAGNLGFGAEGKIVTDLGFKRHLTENDASEDKILPNYQLGQVLKVKPQLIEDKTKVPSRLTEAKLISTLFPKYSLGTPATRAGIIEKILAKCYVTKDTKGQLTPTSKAYVLMDYLKTNPVADPKTTKVWEEGLKLIAQGKVNGSVFVSKIEESVVSQVNEIKAKYGK